MVLFLMVYLACLSILGDGAFLQVQVLTLQLNRGFSAGKHHRNTEQLQKMHTLSLLMKAVQAQMASHTNTLQAELK